MPIKNKEKRKAEEKPKKSNKTNKKEIDSQTVKRLFERQKQKLRDSNYMSHSSKKKSDEPNKLKSKGTERDIHTKPEIMKANHATSHKQEIKQQGEPPLNNNTKPVHERQKQKNILPSPLPPGKLRTPPSIESRPETKRLILSTPDKMDDPPNPPENITPPIPSPPEPPIPATHQDLQSMKTRIIAAMGEMIKPLCLDIKTNNTKLDNFGAELISLHNENTIL